MNREIPQKKKRKREKGGYWGKEETNLVKAGELVDWVDDLLAGGARRVHGEIFPN